MVISQTTKEALDQLYRIQNGYLPNRAIQEELSSKTLTMVIGAACEGKSTVIAEIAKLDPRFAIAGSFTTREPRTDDAESSNYTYYPNTEEGVAQLFSRIGNREVVQFAVHPFSKHLYGSELADYPKTHNIRDSYAGSVAGFREYGFQSTKAITIITEPVHWLKRFNVRFPEGHPQRAARRDEAIQSFEWSLSQPSAEHFWVDNSGKSPDIAAQTIIDIALGKSRGNPTARRLCEQSLAIAREMTL